MSKSTNVSVVKLSDGREVCLSYGVIVAAFIPRGWLDPRGVSFNTNEPTNPRGYLRTDARFSVTTSRHMNQFAGKDAREIPHADLLLLCSPVQSRE